MNISFSLDCVSDRTTAVALGLFDGVHSAHQKVIRTAAEQAVRLGAQTAVFTFTMNRSRPQKKQGQGILISDAIKYSRYSELGVDAVYAPDFDSFRNCEPEEFVKSVLIERLNAVHIVCGYDFRFGAGAAGDCALLKRIAGQNGCAVTVIPEMTDGGEPISSTRIRELLHQGDIETVNRLLGYEYCFDFTVTTGKQLGHKLGFPTINQEYPDGFLVPRYGVYAASAVVDGVSYPAVANIGVKPTVGGVLSPLAETYIIGVDKDLYGENVLVSLKAFLRDEQKFSSLDELKAAIQKNAEQAKALFCN